MLLLCLALLASSGLVSCGGSSSEGDPAAPTTSPAPDGSTPDPSQYLRSVVPRLEPLERLDVALALAYVARRFGHTEDLRWAEELSLDAADDALARRDLATLRPLVRLVRPAEQPRQIVGDAVEPSGEVNTDAMVMRALWCDAIPIPLDFLADVATVANLGGYELTHALASSQMLVENGCEPADAARMTSELAPRVADLLAGSEASDLELESCALLIWAGHGDLVPPDYATVVARSRLPDGGWPERLGGIDSDAHATAWGLRCQLELLNDDRLAPTRWVVDSRG